MPHIEPALDVEAAARFMGVHVETLRRLARSGDIPSFKVGRRWRFRTETLRQWEQSHHLRQRPLLVLVVDDEKSIRETTKAFLEDANYRVATAENGKKALALAQRELPDLVLLDLMMPGMSGVDVLKELHAMDPDLPVVVVTAYPDSALMAQALRYPPITLLPKPLEKSALLRTVNRVLSGSGDRRQQV